MTRLFSPSASVEQALAVLASMDGVVVLGDLPSLEAAVRRWERHFQLPEEPLPARHGAVITNPWSGRSHNPLKCRGDDQPRSPLEKGAMDSIWRRDKR